MQEQDQSKTGAGSGGGYFRFFVLSFGYVAFRFLLSPLRTRLLTEVLSKELYGSLTLAVMTLTFTATLSSLGGFEFLVRRLPGQVPALQKGWLLLLLRRLALPGWLAVGAVVLIARSAGWVSPFLSTTDLSLLWLALGLTSWLLYRVFYSLGCGDLVRVRTIQLLQNDLWFVAILAGGTWAAASLTHAVGVWTGWLAVTVLVVRLWARLPKDTLHPPAGIGTVIRYGAPLLPMICGEILFRLADRYVLLGFFDIRIVAEYTLGMNVTMMVFVVGASLLDLTIPALYAACNRQVRTEQAGPSEDMRRVFGIMVRHVWGISLPAGVALCFFHRDIYGIVSGPAFRDASVLLPWMAFIPLAFLTVTVVSRALLAMDRSRLVGGATLTVAVMNLGLDLVVVPRWGAIGAAMATLFSMVLLAVVLGQVLGWQTWLRREEVRPGAIFVATVVCVGGFALIDRYGAEWSGWLRLLAGGGLTGAALLGCRIFTPKDMLLLKGTAASRAA